MYFPNEQNKVSRNILGFVILVMSMSGLTNTPEGHAAIQRDLDLLEKWTEKNLMKVNRGYCKVLNLGRKTLGCQCMMGASHLGRNSAKKTSGTGVHVASIILSIDSRLTEVILLYSDTAGTMCSLLGLPCVREAWTCWRESNEEPQS